MRLRRLRPSKWLNQAGRLDEAALHFREALRIHPGPAEAYNNLGTVYARQGRLVEAIDAFERALALRPAYAEAHVNIGLAMVSRGRTEEAIPHFREAVRLRPGDDNALGHLQRALRGKRG